jgi:hypothetical protein
MTDWRRRLRGKAQGSGYGAAVAPVSGSPRAIPLTRPSALDRYEGLWVAVLDGEVVMAEDTSHALALKIHDMDHRKRERVVVEYVRPRADSYIVGAG